MLTCAMRFLLRYETYPTRRKAYMDILQAEAVDCGFGRARRFVRYGRYGRYGR
jgi:hypothetical protein